MRNLILLGAPGVGKGIQAKLLAERLGIPQISTGDILRGAASEGTELGRKARTYMRDGNLVPDEIMMGLIRERLTREDCQGGFILDGFPRTLPQAEGLDRLLDGQFWPQAVVISLEVPDREIIRRLTNRRVCRRCGKDFNLLTNPPPDGCLCPVCGGQIVKREDDMEGTIKARLKVYKDWTRPLKNFYRRKGLLRVVDGGGSSGGVFRRILGQLE